MWATKGVGSKDVKKTNGLGKYLGEVIHLMWMVRERAFKAGSQVSDFSNHLLATGERDGRNYEFGWVMLSLRFLQNS